MGYQESYFVPKKEKYFNDIVKEIQEKGQEYYSNYFCEPVEIITFLRDHFPFIKGQKVIYFTGERYPQSHYEELLIPETQKYCNVIFTEYVNPKGIWPDATKNNEYDVVMEKFSFD